MRTMGWGALWLVGLAMLAVGFESLHETLVAGALPVPWSDEAAHLLRFGELRLRWIWAGWTGLDLHAYVWLSGDAYPNGLLGPTLFALPGARSLSEIRYFNIVFLLIHAAAALRFGWARWGPVTTLAYLGWVVAAPLTLSFNRFHLLDNALVAWVGCAAVALSASQGFRKRPASFGFGLAVGLGLLSKWVFGLLLFLPSAAAASLAIWNSRGFPGGRLVAAVVVLGCATLSVGLIGGGSGLLDWGRSYGLDWSLVQWSPGATLQGVPLSLMALGLGLLALGALVPLGRSRDRPLGPRKGCLRSNLGLRKVGREGAGLPVVWLCLALVGVLLVAGPWYATAQDVLWGRLDHEATMQAERLDLGAVRAQVTSALPLLLPGWVPILGLTLLLPWPGWGRRLARGLPFLLGAWLSMEVFAWGLPFDLRYLLPLVPLGGVAWAEANSLLPGPARWGLSAIALVFAGHCVLAPVLGLPGPLPSRPGPHADLAPFADIHYLDLGVGPPLGLARVRTVMNRGIIPTLSDELGVKLREHCGAQMAQTGKRCQLRLSTFPGSPLQPRGVQAVGALNGVPMRVLSPGQTADGGGSPLYLSEACATPTTGVLWSAPHGSTGCGLYLTEGSVR